MFSICLLFSLFIINQTPDEVNQFIIQTKGAWNIFKLPLRFQVTNHRYIFSLQFQISFYKILNLNL